jgi:hypothetical protein
MLVVFVHVQVSVQYRILVEKSYDAYYRLSDPGVQIKSYAFDVIRSTVPRMTVDEAFVSKSDIAESIMERLFEAMRDYGYEILDALITNLTPDEKVKASMNEIEASKRLKEAIPHQAEAGKCFGDLLECCSTRLCQMSCTKQSTRCDGLTHTHTCSNTHRKGQGCKESRSIGGSHVSFWSRHGQSANGIGQGREGVLEWFERANTSDTTRSNASPPCESIP